MSHITNGMITSADRAERSANAQIKELRAISRNLQEQIEKSNKDAKQAKRLSLLTLAVAVATLVFTFLMWLRV